MSGIEDRSSFAGSLADTEADRVRCQFEEDWKAGLAPRLEDYVNRVGRELQPALLKELLLIELSHCAQHRLWPQASDYLPRFPGQEEAVQSAFSTINTVQVDSHQTALNKAPVSFPVPDRSRWVWGNYEIVGELGRGGMGIVYRARDCRTGQIVALKTIQGFSAPVLYRFKNEFRGLADVTHPNLVTFYELVNDDQGWYITMELVEGQDFLTYVRQGIPGPLSSDRIDRLRGALQQLAAGVIALHEAGRLHRDIKPRNVMVTSTGRVVLLDFGLSAELSEAGWHHSTEQAVLGTVPYMSPEQAATQAVSAATDWYSVGVMLYEVLTGQLPFSGSLLAVLRNKQEIDPAAPSTLAPGIPPDLEQLCMQLLARKAQDRPQGTLVRQQLQTNQASSKSELLGVRGLPFIGRQQQLRALHAAFTSMRSGHTTVVGIEGRSGEGKSYLARHFLDELSSRAQVVVLEGRCYEQESVPYKALDSLIDSLSRYLRRLPAAEAQSLLPRNLQALMRLFPVLRPLETLLGSGPVVPDTPDPQELRRRAFMALRELLARIGDRHALVLLIDDLQWGDLDSAKLLSEILRPPDAPLVLMIGCYRTEDIAISPFLREFLSALGQLGNAVEQLTLSVKELSETEAFDLALALLQTSDEPSRVVARGIARESRGNTFFIHELAQHARSGNLPEGTSADTLALDMALWSRIAALPQEARRLLEIVAVAGAPLRQSAALQAAAVEDRGVLSSLRLQHLIRSTGLPEDHEIESYHDRIRETVVNRLDAVSRAAHHLAIAHTLDNSRHSDPEFLAIHYHLGGDLKRAGHFYCIAAGQAAEALAFDRAAKLYQLSLEIIHFDGDEERRLRTKLADALANAGRGRQAAEQYQLSAAGAATADAIEFKRLASQQYLVSGHVDDGLNVLRNVLAATRLDYPSSQRQALWWYLWGQLKLRLEGFRLRNRSDNPPTREELARIDVCWSFVIGLSLVDTIRAAFFQTLHLRYALKSGDTFRAARALNFEAGYASAGILGTAQHAERLFQLAQAIPNADTPYLRGLHVLLKGVASGLLGHWKGSADLMVQAIEILTSSCKNVAWEVGTANRFLMWGLIYMGDTRRARDVAKGVLEDATARNDQYSIQNVQQVALPHFALADDDPAQARELIRALGPWPECDFHVKHCFQAIDLVQTALYEGDVVDAWSTICSLWPQFRTASLLRVDQIRIQLLFARGRASLAVASQTPIGKSAMRQAALDGRSLRREGVQWASALGLSILAGWHCQSGCISKSKQLLSDAITHLDAIHWRLHAAACRRRLGQLVGGKDGDKLVAEADTWMAEQTIKNPARMTAMLVPGFPD